MSPRAEINAARTLPDLCRLGKARGYAVSWLLALAKARGETWPTSEMFRAWERSGV